MFRNWKEANDFINECGAKEFATPSNVFELAIVLKKVKESGCKLYVNPDENCKALKDHKKNNGG